MEFKFNNYKDLNNISLKVKISRKTYNAILIVKNDILLLRVDMTNDIEYWRKADEDFNLLTGNLLYKNIKITFLNCYCHGQQSTGLKEITSATTDYRIDRVLFGKKLTKQEYKNINKYEVEYNNIDCFTNDKPYSMNKKTLEYRDKIASYTINLNQYFITVNFLCNVIHTSTSLSIVRNTSVEFVHSKKINILQMFENIYKFRNFLMILLKKGIIVHKQYVYFGNEKYQILDCRNDNIVKIGDDLEENLNHRCLKIESITNLDEIYKNYTNNYDKLFPVIELYYNVTQFEVPNLTRFVNATTMLEYYSRTFDYSSALILTQSKNPKKLKTNDPEYVDMIKSLLNNVNIIYNYNIAEIDKVSENIKNARVYYIHYKNKITTKKLSYNEQFCYSFFIQDVILLNIYKLLNLDISKYNYISFLNFYYDKKDML